MIFASHWKEWKEDREDLSRIRYLDKSIAATNTAEFADVKSAEDHDRAYQIAREQTKYDENERDWLSQKPLRRTIDRIGLDIPPEHYEYEEWPMKVTLTSSGVRWANKEIRSYKMNNAKDWIAILLPVVSLVFSSTIAILGLLIALKKR